MIKKFFIILKAIITGKNYLPNEKIKNISYLNLNKLKDKKITNIIFDIDQTLTYYRTSKIPKDIENKIKKMNNFKLCAISNYNYNSKKRKKREQEIEKKYGIKVIHSNKQKPNPIAFEKCMNYMKSNSKNTAMIGNTLFTDILGANRLNLYTILVEEIDEKLPITVKIINKIDKKIYKSHKSRFSKKEFE